MLATVIIFPFLFTFATGADIFFSASNDFSAFASCTTPIIAFKTTIVIIIIESIYSPVPCIFATTAEIIAAIIKIIIIKSLNCFKNLTKTLSFFGS